MEWVHIETGMQPNRTNITTKRKPCSSATVVWLNPYLQTLSCGLEVENHIAYPTASPYFLVGVRVWGWLCGEDVSPPLWRGHMKGARCAKAGRWSSLSISVTQRGGHTDTRDPAVPPGRLWHHGEPVCFPSQFIITEMTHQNAVKNNRALTSSRPIELIAVGKPHEIQFNLLFSPQCIGTIGKAQMIYMVQSISGA